MIKRYSDISRTHSIVIDNFNVHTNSQVILERIDFEPVFRIFCRDVSNNQVFGERFTLLSAEASQYWSQLMGEKEFLF